MANTVNINQNNNDVSLQDNNRRIIVTDNNAGTTTNVTQPVTSIVTISALGPQGAQGPAGEIPDTGSFVLTSSFNAFTSSYYTDSASFEAQILSNSSSIALLSGSFETTSGSFSTRITNLEDFSSSLDVTFATDAELNAATASLSASISYLSSSFETFSGSYNTGSFTGSFTGDGSQLTGIVSSKWTGSNPISRDGNVEITGSLNVTNGITASLYGTASNATTASYFNETDPIFVAKSGSFATTGSNTFIGTQTITGSNGRLIYRGTTLGVYPTNTLAEIHANDDYPWLERFYNDTFSTSSAIMAYFGWNDGRFVFHNESTQSIGLQVNGFGAENGLLVYSDKVAFVNNAEVTGSLNVFGGITGSLFGTASWANNAITASFITASGVYGPYGSNSVITSSYSLTALSASHAITSSYAISSSYAATASYSQNIQISGSVNNVDYIDFNTSSAIPAWKSGRVFWDNTDGALSVYNAEQDITLQVGQENWTRVSNRTGTTITNGTVVRLLGAHGDLPEVERAQALLVSGSVNLQNQILGVATHDIEDNSKGFVTTQGLVRGLNTNAFNDGDTLFVGTGSSGVLQNTAPQAPYEIIPVGVCVKASPGGSGIIYVAVQEPIDFSDLSSALVEGTYSYGDLWTYVQTGSVGVWKHTNQLSGSYGLTGSLNATQITASNLYAGNAYVSGSLTVFGPSTFYGTASFVNVTASNLFISESFISVNIFEPIERFGGLKVYDSGSSTASASLAWDSLHNHWVYQNVDGLTYTGGMLLSGPRNTGSLGDEPNLTKWLVPRSDGGDHLDNSQIFTSASITQITGSLTVTAGITGSLFGNASTATSASFANTASYVLNAVSSSFATSASFALTASHLTGYVSPFPFTGSAIITGSLGVTGSVSITQNITASRVTISASNATSNGPTLTVYGSGSTQPVFTVQGSQGELFSVTDSLSGSLFSVNDISGLPILEVFSDNTTLIGNYLDPMLITTAKVTQTNSGSFVVYSLPTASYDTAFFEYSVRSGSNARAGTIMAIQSGSSVNFTETTTLDFGSTTAISFTVIVTGSNMALTGSSTTGAWTIKSIVRGL